MKVKIYLLLVAIVCLIQGGFAQHGHNTDDTLYATRLKPYGRYLYNAQNELELISSAVHFGFTFRGSRCAVYGSVTDPKGHSYIQYELDGIYQGRVRVNGDPAVPIIINTIGEGEHKVWVYKATEALTGPIVISKIVAGHVRPLSVSKAPLIEFIGNSITCGAASDTSVFPCGAGSYQDYHNAYMAYGPRVARDLGLNYILSSVSGIGVYRTWNMDGPSMPQVYEHTDLRANSPNKWDFKKYRPKIVSIALGTNDLSNGDGKTPRKPFEEQVFISSYVNFVKLVKSKYPKARIALLSSPMVEGASRSILEKCLTAIKAQVDSLYPSGKPVETFFFPPMKGQGCSGHPSVAQHLILAAQLTPFYQRLLK